MARLSAFLLIGVGVTVGACGLDRNGLLDTADPGPESEGGPESAIDGTAGEGSDAAMGGPGPEPGDETAPPEAAPPGPRDARAEGNGPRAAIPDGAVPPMDGPLVAIVDDAESDAADATDATDADDATANRRHVGDRDGRRDDRRSVRR